MSDEYEYDDGGMEYDDGWLYVDDELNLPVRSSLCVSQHRAYFHLVSVVSGVSIPLDGHVCAAWQLTRCCVRTNSQKARYLNLDIAGPTTR